MSLDTCSDTFRKMEIRSDTIRRQNSTHKKASWEALVELRKRASASIQVISIKSLTYTSSFVRSYVLAEFDMKTFIKECHMVDIYLFGLRAYCSI